MAITFTKLRDETWGLRSTTNLPFGQTVVVEKKDGTTSTAVVGEKVWAGNGVVLYRAGGAKSASKHRAWRPCGYPGCTQGRHCDECDGEGG